MPGNPHMKQFDPTRFEIASTSSQVLALALQRFGAAAPNRKVYLRVPGVDEATLAAWQRVLRSSLAECGCKAGKIAILLACIAVPAVQLSGVQGAFHLRTCLVEISVCVILAGAVGKFLALELARMRIRYLARLIRNLELRRDSSFHEAKPMPLGCGPITGAAPWL